MSKISACGTLKSTNFMKRSEIWPTGVRTKQLNFGWPAWDRKKEAKSASPNGVTELAESGPIKFQESPGIWPSGQNYDNNPE